MIGDLAETSRGAWTKRPPTTTKPSSRRGESLYKELDLLTWPSDLKLAISPAKTSCWTCLNMRSSATFISEQVTGPLMTLFYSKKFSASCDVMPSGDETSPTADDLMVQRRQWKAAITRHIRTLARSVPWVRTTKGDVFQRRWRHVQHVVGHFWARWLKEYLPELNRRQKWLDKKPNLKVGDMVLIIDENAPRGSWPLARVAEVHVGRDGLVRSARLKTKTTFLVRPVTKLVFLEGAHYEWLHRY